MVPYRLAIVRVFVMQSGREGKKWDASTRPRRSVNLKCIYVEKVPIR